MPEDRDAIIDQLLDRWEEAYEAGMQISPEELCFENPEVLSDVRHKIGVLQTMDRCLKQQGGPIDNPDGSKDLTNDSFRVNSKYGDFEVLGSGGLGVVYRAIDCELNRDVAIKFLRDKNQSEYFLEQFKAEAEITGRLDHPGVVPVYALGKSRQGEPFYSMRLIRGQSLDQKIKDFHGHKGTMRDGERRIQMHEMLREFVTVCKTIAYAHTRGILHRDIKPQNIMLGKYGETLVVDWGLAIPFQRQDQFRVLDEKTLLPRKSEGQSSPDGHGTPAYMSPEQAAGTQKLVPSSDIFALGATLFKLLTGEIPFQGKSSLEVKQKIMAGEFDPPHQVDRSVSKPISSVCAKALEHRPEDRYQTSLDLAEDIELYLADEPVSTYPESLSRRAARWAVRNRALAQWGTVALITALAGAVITSAVQFQAAKTNQQIKRDLDQSLARALSGRKSSARMTTRLIAESIEFELQTRYTWLDQAASRLEQLQLDTGSDDAASKQKLDELIEPIRFEADCVRPSMAWLVIDGKKKITSLFYNDVDVTEVAETAIESLMRKLSGEKSGSINDVSQLSPIVFTKDGNSAVCLLTSPIKNSKSCIGMLFSIENFTAIHSDELDVASVGEIKLGEIVGDDSRKCFFRSESTNRQNGSASGAESKAGNRQGLDGIDKATFDWLKSDVDVSEPVVREKPNSQIQSAIRISVQTGSMTPVDCEWYLVVDFN